MDKKKSCADCMHCKVRLTGLKDPLKESNQIFDDKRVINIDCELGLLSKNYTSMKVFEEATIPVTAAENCGFFTEDN